MLSNNRSSTKKKYQSKNTHIVRDGIVEFTASSFPENMVVMMLVAMVLVAMVLLLRYKAPLLSSISSIPEAAEPLRAQHIAVGTGSGALLRRRKF